MIRGNICVNTCVCVWWAKCLLEKKNRSTAAAAAAAPCNKL